MYMVHNTLHALFPGCALFSTRSRVSCCLIIHVHFFVISGTCTWYMGMAWVGPLGRDVHLYRISSSEPSTHQIREMNINAALRCRFHRCVGLLNIRRRFQNRASNISSHRNDWKRENHESFPWRFAFGSVATASLIMGWYIGDKNNRTPVAILSLQAADGEESKVRKVSLRERRYKDFASVMYHGEPYMTGRDFLEAVTKMTPRCECTR